MKSIPKNWIGLTTLLFVAAGLQVWLLAHVTADDERAPTAPTASLSSLPMRLGDWQGTDKPVEEQLHYADDFIHRVYRHEKTGQLLTLWVAYSSTAADRGHHPQVCMAVLGKPENKRRAALVPVEGHAAPIQRLHFGSPGAAVWTYYWHYALPRNSDDRGTAVQRLYQRTRQLPPSVTLEVFSDDRGPRDLAASEEFVRLIDGSMQRLVGDGAKRGHSSLPVTIVPGG